MVWEAGLARTYQLASQEDETAAPHLPGLQFSSYLQTVGNIQVMSE